MPSPVFCACTRCTPACLLAYLPAIIHFYYNNHPHTHTHTHANVTLTGSGDQSSRFYFPLLSKPFVSGSFPRSKFSIIVVVVPIRGYYYHNICLSTFPSPGSQFSFLVS
jgi:hypothetical protein